jgi:2',3'-cyclic-nucleotide 2'-phosphodiesterase
MRILFLGDVVGRPARRAIRARLRDLRTQEALDFVIANGENAAGGKGIDVDSAEELFDAGVDVITSGNHIWQHRQIIPYFEREPRLLRPANFAAECPGAGWVVRAARDGTQVAVLNLIGRVFMGSFDCPFRRADAALKAIAREGRVVVVDMHGEATSEKVAMGWYLDGRVSAVVGSHTHVQTADERVLPGGTAYLTDAGMCGPIDSVIGMRKEEVLQRFRNQMPVRFEVAPGPVILQGAILEIDRLSGRADGIRRFQEVQPPC